MICLEFFYRLTSDWQDLGRPSTGQWDMDAKKRGCEKQSDHLYGDPQTFRALNECVRFFPSHKRPDNLK